MAQTTSWTAAVAKPRGLATYKARFYNESVLISRVDYAVKIIQRYVGVHNRTVLFTE
jgi:hypothetical protein